MVNLEAAPMPRQEEEKLALDSNELLKQGDQFKNPGENLTNRNLHDMPEEAASATGLESLGERRLGAEDTQYNVDVTGLRTEQSPGDDVIELSSDDLEILDDETPNAEGAIELDSSDLIEEPAGIANEDDSEYSLDKLTAMAGKGQEQPEEIELDMEDMEEVFERTLEASPLSKLGEFVEQFGEDGPVKAELRLGTLYGDKDRPKTENIEDSVAFNRSENMIALGDGMGGMGSGDKAAKVFKDLFENMTFGDLSNLSEAQIQEKVAAELNIAAGSIEEGMITCSMLKFFKDAEGNDKAVVVNIGDGGLYQRTADGNFAEIGEGASPWDGIKSVMGDIFDNPSGWSAALNGMSRVVKYPQMEEYLTKNANAAELQSLKEKFDFHTILNFVANDSSLDDESKEKIYKLFKNINRQSPDAFNMPNKDGSLKEITADKIKIIDVNPGDRFFIASDGVVDNFDDRQIEAMMQNDFASEAGRAAVKADLDANLKNKAYLKADDYSYVPIEFTA